MFAERRERMKTERSSRTRLIRTGLVLVITLLVGQACAILPCAAQWGPPMGDPVVGAARQPTNDRELKYWLTNMVVDHRFSLTEAQAATGLSADALQEACQRWEILEPETSRPDVGRPLKLRPYPGGRHPRIGFLDGAIRPQRETKFSVFLPWDPTSYVVADIPEAIWSNLGLTYLAHTHIETVWDQQKKTLAKLEWQRDDEDHLWLQRELPNGLIFGSEAKVDQQRILMRMWLDNPTDQTFSDLRVQNCIMLKAAKGFEAQEEENKLVRGSYVACHNREKDRWIITAWEPLHRAWGNPPCPCLHSDPRFPDTGPGGQQHLSGILTFHEGRDIEDAIQKLDQSGWQDAWKGKKLPTAATETPSQQPTARGNGIHP